MPTTSHDDRQAKARRDADRDLREQAAAFELLGSAGTTEERERDEADRRAVRRWLKSSETE